MQRWDSLFYSSGSKVRRQALDTRRNMFLYRLTFVILFPSEQQSAATSSLIVSRKALLGTVNQLLATLWDLIASMRLGNAAIRTLCEGRCLVQYAPDHRNVATFRAVGPFRCRSEATQDAVASLLGPYARGSGKIIQRLIDGSAA